MLDDVRSRKATHRMFKMAVQRGRSKRRGEAYSGYVEPLNAARTKLADFFNILLGAEGLQCVCYMP